ncbi:helix-turn-helix domain-containing protein [Pseudomonas cavernae]|uniref:Helix-turn-helix domain-containing protein n=1 Tax=Pseudomonas cavernae TaxID=2320867 RepID=A0A385Z8G2_9PSED|nr:helix-turn-helix domain-containing protein [Pseudomonas cavernae]AYC35051.1 helix-turn-helix domain-containing protein [Pseudomonas cavernae]
MAARSSNSVPVFKLYGETAWPTPDLIHCESIAERSRLHDWLIRPHRHTDLVQLLYVQRGEAWLEVEGVANYIDAPALQVVPALAIHGFRFSPDVQGHVLSLAMPLVEQLAAEFAPDLLRQAGCYLVGADRPRLDTLFASIADEYQQQESGRDQMLTALITTLLIWGGRRVRLHGQADAGEQAPGREHLRAFTRLLEAHFREHWPIERYANQLGISAAHLNALCRRFAGMSALQLINQRLLLEARRCLVYTAMTIAEVSDSMGFSEPAYFSRFFKKGLGVSPKEFRAGRTDR